MSRPASTFDLVIATRNLHKVRELKSLLRLRHVRWRSLQEFPGVPPVKEDGRTFADNAAKKARAAARATGCLALADDSGLEVRALNGEPGVRSARFAGRHGDDAANNALVLRRLAGAPRGERAAQFRCVLVLADPRRVLAMSEGRLRGWIGEAPRGRQGFGYDPIFVVPGGKTVAELPMAVKNRISHRARAAAGMRRTLARLAAASGRAAAARRSRQAIPGSAAGRG